MVHACECAGARTYVCTCVLLSSPLLPSDGVSLPEPEIPCFLRLTGQESVGICLSPSGVTDSTQLCLAFPVGFEPGLRACRADILSTGTSPRPIN